MRGEGVREGCKGAVKIAGNEGGWHSMADGFSGDCLKTFKCGTHYVLLPDPRLINMSANEMKHSFYSQLLWKDKYLRILHTPSSYGAADSGEHSTSVS